MTDLLAELLGIPIGTLMSRLFRACVALMAMANAPTHDVPDDAPI